MRIRIGKLVYEPKGIAPFDWLLIFGLMLAPMTGFRIWKVGPAEVLCLLWGVGDALQLRAKRTDLSRFFSGFYIALLLGTLIGLIVAPRELDASGLLTWAYLGITAILITEKLHNNTLDYNEKLLSTLAVISILWYLFLYVYATRFAGSIWGTPLWFGKRFTGGGTNPHQVAVFFCGIGFVFLRAILNKKQIILAAAGYLASAFLLWQNDSSTGKMAIALGTATAVFLFVSESFPEHKALIIVLTVVASSVILIVGAQFWLQLFWDWVSEDANGMGRIEIFSSYPAALVKSPLFGLGPGTHGVNGRIEFHNTYLEILAATGLIGGYVFTVYTVRLAKKIMAGDWSLLPIMISLYAFGFAGFAMRRLIYWGLISFISVIAEQTGKNEAVTGSY